MGVFISSDFIDLLLSSSSVVVFRCLVPRSFMSTLTFGLPVSFLSTSMAYVILCWAWRLARGWDFVQCPHECTLSCRRFLGWLWFVLLPYGIDGLLFLQSHGLKVVWDGDVCSAHFKHLGCGCLQVECKQLLDKFLVTEGSDESALDVPFLFLIWWKVTSVSKSLEAVNEFIWWLSRSDANIFQLIDPAVLWHCMIHRKRTSSPWKLKLAFSSLKSHQLCQLASNGQTSCGWCCPGNWAHIPVKSSWVPHQVQLLGLFLLEYFEGWTNFPLIYKIAGNHHTAPWCSSWKMGSQVRLMAGSEGVSWVLLSEQQLDLLGQVLPWLDVIKEEHFEATEGNNSSEECNVVWFHNWWVDLDEILTQYPWNGVVPIFTTRRYHCHHHDMRVVPPM